MHLVDIVNLIVLAIIMLGIGTSLRGRDFKVFLHHPRPVLFGLGMQMLFMPLVYFVMTHVLDVRPEFSVGIMIMSLCPGGVTSNFMSYLLRLDTALSISLTTINSLLIMFTIPVATNFFLKYYMGETTTLTLPVASTMGSVVFVVLLPVIAGMLLNRQFSEFTRLLQDKIKFVNIVLLGLVFGIKFFGDTSQGGSGITKVDVLELLPMLFLAHLLVMFSSYFVSRLIMRRASTALTIMIEVSLQNTALAVLITSVLLHNNEMTKPALVATLFAFPATVLIGYLASRQPVTKKSSTS